MSYKVIKLSVTVFGIICLIAVSTCTASDISQRRRQLRRIESRISTDKTLPDNPTLDDYVKTGLLRNPGLKASFYKWQGSFKKITQAFSLADPKFTYTEYIDEVETRVGPQRRAYSVMQSIPLPDKLWIRKDKAFKASEAEYYDFEKTRLELIYKISDAYYEYAYAAKAIALTEENMKLLKTFENVAQTKYASGIAKNQDLLKVQVELGKLENNLLSLKDLRKPLMAQLNALLNLSEGRELPWPDEALEHVNIDNPYQLETFELADDLRRSNPELLALSKNVEKNEEALKLSMREYFPDLSVEVKTIDTGQALMPTAVDSGKDPVMLMFSVNVPIWFWRINAEVEEAKASLEVAENMRKGKEQELLSRLALVHYKLRDAIRQAGLYKDALIPKAVQALNATQSGYTAGDVDFLSLIDAQRVLLNFELSYYRYTANFNQRLAEVKNLLGEIEGYNDLT
ncbi:MAG: TolC family protein [Candidatus Omnitrophota bacterium]